MPSHYDLLRRYARGIGREQVESPAAGLEFYAMVSTVGYKCSLLMVEKLRAISLEQDRVVGDVMRWQYGAAEALHYICVLHGGDEDVERRSLAPAGEALRRTRPGRGVGAPVRGELQDSVVLRRDASA